MNRSCTAFVLTLALAACTAKVGDDCASNTDCGRTLVCDLAQPEGYCTLLGCRTNECPDEGVCVHFADGTAACMFRCKDDSDCRDGYTCVSNFGDAPFCNGTSYTPPPATTSGKLHTP